jgi:predicted nucleotidyltransferase component of viral defense system
VSKDKAASIRARLLQRAKAEKSDFDQVLVRFALERILYRLGQSPYADRFLLKGALLFALWYDMPHRPTRDVDLLGFGSTEADDIKAVFTLIAEMAVDDGIHFNTAQLRVDDIRKVAAYPGLRVTLDAELARAVCKVQIDIGFGDAVTPEAVQASFPTLLSDLPAPQLRTYPVYTVVAEKLHAIVLLGMGNTRMKDYYDLMVLSEREILDERLLAKAIHATFTRRQTLIPVATPTGLSEVFAADPSKQTQWRSFLQKNDLRQFPLASTVALIHSKLSRSLFIASATNL